MYIFGSLLALVLLTVFLKILRKFRNYKYSTDDYIPLLLIAISIALGSWVAVVLLIIGIIWTLFYDKFLEFLNKD